MTQRQATVSHQKAFRFYCLIYVSRLFIRQRRFNNTRASLRCLNKPLIAFLLKREEEETFKDAAKTLLSLDTHR